MTTSVSWSGFSGSQWRGPAALCWGVHIRDHGAAPWSGLPWLSTKWGDKSSMAGKVLFFSKVLFLNTDKNFPSEKCQSRKILQGQISLVNSNDWSFLASCPLACNLAIPSVPALHSISRFPAIKLAAWKCHPELRFPGRHPCKAARRAGIRGVRLLLLLLLLLLLF